jgi:hypothetical protein
VVIVAVVAIIRDGVAVSVAWVAIMLLELSLALPSVPLV